MATIKFQEIIDLAAVAFDSYDSAIRWLQQPLAALDYQSPLTACLSEEGMKAVTGLLMAIEHGLPA